MDAQPAGRAWRPGLRVVLTLLVAAYMFAAWGSGLDRISASIPTLERLVPGPFRAAAERSAATVALSRNAGDHSLAAAEKAVAADPLNPRSTSLLGSARSFTGDAAGAEKAFRVAGQLGWRDTLTQLYWFEAALQMGDIERAALRADAVLRTDPRFFAAAPLLRTIEVDEKGRTALAERLAARPPWLGAYLTPVRDTPDEDLHRRAEVLLALSRLGTRLGCDTPRPLVTRLLDRGMRRDAEAVWQAHCTSSTTSGGLSDPGFEQIASDKDASPFGWQRRNSGDVALRFAAGNGGGHALVATNTGSVSRLMLVQAVGLAPGRYRISADVTANGSAAPGRVMASLDCGTALSRPQALKGDMAADGQTVEIGTCQSQLLGLWLRPGNGPVTIDDIRLERID